MLPSGFMTSQMTPAGWQPARRARSTEASVCPVRSSTPPERARSGKMWPGWIRSRAPMAGSTATLIVCARSAVEMPVAMPSRASIETVKAVWYGVSLCATIMRSPSSSQRSGVSVRQISPRPCVAMKLMASGVTCSAAMQRSPSFSRSGASTTMTSFPFRMSSSASSIRLNGGGGSLIRAVTVDDPSMAQTRWARRRSTYFASWSTSMLTRLPGASRPAS